MVLLESGVLAPSLFGMHFELSRRDSQLSAVLEAVTLFAVISASPPAR